MLSPWPRSKPPRPQNPRTGAPSPAASPPRRDSQFENGAAPIHRVLGVRFRCVFANQIVKSRQPVCRAYARQCPRRDPAHHLGGRRVMRLALLEHVQQHGDVQRDLHPCFFSRCSQWVSSPATSGEIMPVALITSGRGGRCKCSRKLCACRARNASAEVPCDAEKLRRKARSSSGSGTMIVLMARRCQARALNG